MRERTGILKVCKHCNLLDVNKKISIFSFIILVYILAIRIKIKFYERRSR